MTAPNKDELLANSPARIWATVNGASTRLPDGGRQFIGGWSEDAERPRAVEYARADLASRATEEVSEEIARLREGIRDIALACVERRVCDDVAWFTEIPAETLFDKCCSLLDMDLPTDAALLSAYSVTKR